MNKLKFLVAIVLSAVMVATFSFNSGSAAVPRINELVSVDSSEIKATNGATSPTVSADGRYVTFKTTSSLVAADTDGGEDIYIRDVASGTTDIVSISTSGTVGNGGASEATISYDGRYIVWKTNATNLVGVDSFADNDVYLRDTLNGTTELISVDGSGNPLGNAQNPQISSDGRFVIYLTNSGAVYSRDRATSTTELVSKDTSGNATGGAGSPIMSCDGAIIAYSSSESDIVSGDTNGKSDIFIVERIGSTSRTVSPTISGNDNSYITSSPVASGLSCDGNYLAFQSYATNLVAGDTNAKIDIFRFSRVNGQTELVSKSTSGTIGNNNSTASSVSGDGRYITFKSQATNLVAGDTNAEVDIFIRDIKTSTTELLSQNSAGTYGNGSSYDAFMSTDGKYVVYYTSASNLVATDTDGTTDILISQTGY